MTDSPGRMVCALSVVIAMLFAVRYADNIAAWLTKDDYVRILLSECELIEVNPIDETRLGTFHGMAEEYERGRFKCGNVETGHMIPKNR